MNPLISIIIPTYQAAITLERALESILAQSLKNFEVLIMDGGSTDNTIQIAGRYAKQYEQVRYFIEPDNGIYDAMNKGIEQAKGEWLIFLGSDDLLFDKDVLLKTASEIKSADSKVVYGNVKVVGNSVWAKDGEIYDGEFTLEKLLRKNICHQAILYHHSVFKSLGCYNVLYRICADYEFNLRCYAEYKFKYLPITMVYFHAGGESTLLRDKNFAKDMWVIVAKSFGLKLFTSDFQSYAAKLWYASKRLFLEKDYLLFAEVACASFYHKLFFNKW